MNTEEKMDRVYYELLKLKGREKRSPDVDFDDFINNILKEMVGE